MVQQREVQGRIYTFTSQREYARQGRIVDIPNFLRSCKVLVLDVVPERKHHVKIMAITSILREEGEYVPISPTLKKGFPIQLRLRSHTTWSRGSVVTKYPSLGRRTFLKIDQCYVVPIQSLVEATDRDGNPYVILSKGQGGVKQLRHHVQQRDAERASSTLAVEMNEVGKEAVVEEDLSVEVYDYDALLGILDNH